MKILKSNILQYVGETGTADIPTGNIKGNVNEDGSFKLEVTVFNANEFFSEETQRIELTEFFNQILDKSKEISGGASKEQKAGVMEEQAWREVLERLARIETKLDNYETVRDKAERALLIAQSNAKLIEKMEANNKWAWGFMLTLAVTVIGYIITKIL